MSKKRGRTAPILGILGAPFTALLDGLQQGQPVTSLVKMVRSGDGWLGIFTVDVLPTADSVSSILVALLHDDWRAFSTRAHSRQRLVWQSQMCWNERELCSDEHCFCGRHLWW